MRRISLVLILSLFVALFSGCANTKETESLLLYYRAADVSHAEGLICAEPAAEDQKRSVEALARRYFMGPRLDTLRSPFPKGTAVEEFSVTGSQLFLHMNEEFSSLSGVDLSLALTCISMTFFQLDEITSVEIAFHGGIWGGNQAVLLREGDIILSDNSLDLAQSKITVYYADQDNRYLIPVEVNTKLERLEERAALAVSMLSETPERAELRLTLPKNTEILDLSIENGECIIDFSDDFYRYRNKSESGERMTILSVVNTLTQFTDIQSVQILVEGNSLLRYSFMDLRKPFVRDESAIGPVRSGLSEQDANLFVIRSCDSTMTGLPIRLKPETSQSAAEAMLDALLEFEEKNGYVSAISPETVIRSVHTETGHCTVDLSQAFLEGIETHEQAIHAVYSVVRSLMSLENVRSVRITVEGESPVIFDIDLKNVFR